MLKRDWITCGELLDNGLMPFELFGKFKNRDLMPHDPIYGKKIVDADSLPHERERTYEEILEIEKKINRLRGGDAGTAMVYPNRGSGPSEPPWTQAQVENEAREKYERLPRYPVPPPDCIPKSFTISTDPAEAKRQIQEARTWIVPVASVSGYEEKPHQNSLFESFETEDVSKPAKGQRSNPMKTEIIETLESLPADKHTKYHVMAELKKHADAPGSCVIRPTDNGVVWRSPKGEEKELDLDALAGRLSRMFGRQTRP